MLVVYGDVPQLLVMGMMVYGDVHCVIVDGDDDSGVDDSCQTFSPNCAVKLPMSPSIRGKPVHVFAEDCLTYFKLLLSSARNYFFSWPNFFHTYFRNVYQASEHDLRNLNSISIEFSFFKAISPA